MADDYFKSESQFYRNSYLGFSWCMFVANLKVYHTWKTTLYNFLELCQGSTYNKYCPLAQGK